MQCRIRWAGISNPECFSELEGEEDACRRILDILSMRPGVAEVEIRDMQTGELKAGFAQKGYGKAMKEEWCRTHTCDDDGGDI